jgi:capsular polysaccharide biosynthesis protein
MSHLFIPQSTTLEGLVQRTTPSTRRSLFGRRRRAPVLVRAGQLSGAEMYELQGVLHRTEGPAEQPFFLDYTQYAALPFRMAEVRNVASTRHAKAIAVPGAGFVDEFNVGGTEHLRRDLLAGDLEPADGGWLLDENDLEVLDGLSVPFCHYGYCAFGHFVLDGLMQVYLFRSELSTGSARLVHWPFERDWMGPALDACGVPPRARRELRQAAVLMRRGGLSSALAAHGVYFPTSVAHGFFAWLRAMFRADENGGDEKIYIRRDPASGRAVHNQPVLEQLLLDRGFRIVTGETLSIGEQVRLFAGAKLAMAPFGSGLTLAPLLDGEKRVIELLPSTTTDAWFTRQAAVHRLNYHPIVHHSASDGSFEADLERIDRVLAALPTSGS